MRSDIPDGTESDHLDDYDWNWTAIDEDWIPPAVDTTKPSAARMYDYYLGGKDNFAVDRDAAEKVTAALPDVRYLAQSNRAFLIHAVRHISEAGVRQFIDLGTGIPTPPNVHEIARKTHPDARVAYVDNDPIVVAHNRALRATAPGVITIQQDLRDPASVLGDPQLQKNIDFDKPVAMLFIAVLHFVKHALSSEVLAQYRKAMAPGSMLAISAITAEGMSMEKLRQLEKIYAATAYPATYRSRAQVEQLFEGFELVEPGLADVTEWRASGVPGSVRVLCGVGRRT